MKGGKKIIFPALLIGTVLALIYRLFNRAVVSPTSAKPVSKGATDNGIDAYIKEQSKGNRTITG